jgi:hypothetical protein
MTRRSIKHLAIALCLVLAALTGKAQSRRTEKPRLAGMRAMLFYETNGKFSPDIFTNQVNLWNTVIEGTSREGASESMLVILEVAGDLDLVPEGKTVELTARYRIENKSGRGIPAFFRKSMRINLGTDHKFFAGFWLYQTGCHPVELTARILGQKERIHKTINLRCGE